jgi:hypothetical protein
VALPALSGGVCNSIPAGIIKRIRRKFYAKYPQYPKKSAIEPEDSLIIELIRRKEQESAFMQV